MKFEWENLFSNYIDETHFSYCDRAQVFGGWIVNNRTCAGARAHESMVFIPDVHHEWVIDK